MENADWRAIWFTLVISTMATVCILPPGVFTAWMLARKSWRGKAIVETVVMLPLVLPPVATGLILLKVFGRRGPVGGFLEKYSGVEVAFTWKGVLLALGVMSFPLLVRTARVAFEEVNPRLEQVARTLGARPSRVFFTITLPLALRGVLGGALLAFARALGEFGATMLVAGAIPGQTATLSVTIYNLIQLGHDEAATRLVMISISLSFAAVLGSEYLTRRRRL
ncbi:MAG TPA: molybdate ABC transporter permease subunit [Verrucomicrobiae bacterium]|nr:molybdate ABC transporter permease subunit [Verrucomicrobiae bacterium]